MRGQPEVGTEPRRLAEEGGPGEWGEREAGSRRGPSGRPRRARSRRRVRQHYASRIPWVCVGTRPSPKIRRQRRHQRVVRRPGLVQPPVAKVVQKLPNVRPELDADDDPIDAADSLPPLLAPQAHQALLAGCASRPLGEGLERVWAHLEGDDEGADHPVPSRGGLRAQAERRPKPKAGAWRRPIVHRATVHPSASVADRCSTLISKATTTRSTMPLHSARS